MRYAVRYVWACYPVLRLDKAVVCPRARSPLCSMKCAMHGSICTPPTPSQFVHRAHSEHPPAPTMLAHIRADAIHVHMWAPHPCPWPCGSPDGPESRFASRLGFAARLHTQVEVSPATRAPKVATASSRPRDVTRKLAGNKIPQVT